MQFKYGVPEPGATYFAPRFSNAIMAHYAGDEKITPEEQTLDEEVLGTPGMEPLGMALESLWTDLPPADNEIHLDLK